jgi:NusA-like KH domain protein
MARTYTTEHLQWFSLFEKVTRVPVRDFFTFRNRMLFIIPEKTMVKALGKNMVNLRKLEESLKRKIKIVEFSPDMLKLIVNILAPLKVTRMEEQDGVVTISGPDTKTRGLMIGARAQNLRALEEIIREYHPELKEIRVE